MADIHQVLLGLCESIDDVQHFAWIAANLDIWAGCRRNGGVESRLSIVKLHYSK